MRFSIPTVRLVHRVNQAAPVACLVSLLGAGLLLTQLGESDRSNAGARARTIRTNLESVPFLAGNWVGSDCPLPAGATEILMPTAVLSRRYVELGAGRRALLGIIHCGDVRDMHGHHPPSCYPASGWLPRETGHDQLDLAMEGEPFRASVYRFSSSNALGARRELTVVAFFILPDGTVTSDMEQLRPRAAKREISRMGVGQIQVVLDGWPSTELVGKTTRELLAFIPMDCTRALKGQVGVTATARSVGSERIRVGPRGVSDASRSDE